MKNKSLKLAIVILAVCLLTVSGFATYLVTKPVTMNFSIVASYGLTLWNNTECTIPLAVTQNFAFNGANNPTEILVDVYIRNTGNSIIKVSWDMSGGSWIPNTSVIPQRYETSPLAYTINVEDQVGHQHWNPLMTVTILPSEVGHALIVAKCYTNSILDNCAGTFTFNGDPV